MDVYIPHRLDAFDGWDSSLDNLYSVMPSSLKIKAIPSSSMGLDT